MASVWAGRHICSIVGTSISCFKAEYAGVVREATHDTMLVDKPLWTRSQGALHCAVRCALCSVHCAVCSVQCAAPLPVKSVHDPEAPDPVQSSDRLHRTVPRAGRDGPKHATCDARQRQPDTCHAITQSQSQSQSGREGVDRSTSPITEQRLRHDSAINTCPEHVISHETWHSPAPALSDVYHCARSVQR